MSTNTTTPTTGPSGGSWKRIPEPAQLVEVRKTVQKITVSKFVEVETQQPALCNRLVNVGGIACHTPLLLPRFCDFGHCFPV